MKLHKTPMLGRDKFNKTVIGIPESQYDPAFDSTFERSVDSSRNCTLRITLRIFYRQINPWEVTSPMLRVVAASLGLPVPTGASVGSHKDADEEAHFIKGWSAGEWSNFINAVKMQAKLWDNRFWLVPPDDFSLLDIDEGDWNAKSGKRTTRPNVKCEFDFQIAPIPSVAHSSVDVVNLLGPSNFRSHSRLYNSDDATVSSRSRPDWQGIMVNTSYPVIAHEIGHSLGQPHIGVLRNLPHCSLAIIMNKSFQQDTVPALYKGGTNASMCYGRGHTAGDINNIMGAGSAFGIENAKPWLDRLPHHFNLGVAEYTRMISSFGKWKVSMTEALPMSLVGFK